MIAADGPLGSGGPQVVRYRTAILAVNYHDKHTHLGFLALALSDRRPESSSWIGATMPNSLSPPCPTCGNLQPEKVSERRADLSGTNFFARPEGSEKEIFYVFRCKCGTSFTHVVRPDERRQAAS
jgi:hypothetical protein